MRLFILAGLCLLVTQQSFAWCHIWNIKSDSYRLGDGTEIITHREYYLIFKIVQKNSIRFCAISEAPQIVSDDNLALQTKVALNSWLKPLYALGLAPVEIVRTHCSDSKLDLKVAIYNDNSRDPGEGGQSTREGPYNYVGIVNGSRSMPLKDTVSQLAAKAEDFERKLSQESTLPPSSYHVILHELGHAMGLAHSNSHDSSCDENHSSPIRPLTGVMGIGGGDGHIHLTEDDIMGIQSLYKRFAKP